MGTKRKEAFRSTFRTLGYSAKKREIPVEFTFEDFLQFTEIGCCFYCGGPIKWVPYGHASATNLDRKDNSLGYTLDNVVVTCYKCNTLKSNFFESEEFKAVMKVHEIWQDGKEEDKLELMYYLLSWKDKYEY